MPHVVRALLRQVFAPGEAVQAFACVLLVVVYVFVGGFAIGGSVVGFLNCKEIRSYELYALQ